MNDNMNNLTATLDGCSVKTENIESLGAHTFLSADSPSSRVVIESADIGGIPSFIGDEDKYFIIKYMGKMPKITYQYHFNDSELDTIFEIDPSGDRFGKLTFSPNDDVAVGSAETILNLGSLDNYGANLLHGVDVSVTSSTFAVHSYIGMSRSGSLDEDSFIGISAYSNGNRASILKVLGSGLTLGSISKRIVITLDETTKLESFAMGTLKLFEALPTNEDVIFAKSTLFDMMIDPEYSSYYGNIKKFKKMIDHPNSMFNTESGL